MARTLKNEPGDWVAIPAPGAEGGRKPAKVIRSNRDSVTVSARFENGMRELTFDTPQPRIRWTRQRGRTRWTLV